MSAKRLLVAALTAPLLLAGLAACESTSVSCDSDACDVSVTSDDSAEVEVFDEYRLQVGDLLDDSVSLTFQGEKITVKEGQTGTLGPLSVYVEDADAGKTELIVRR